MRKFIRGNVIKYKRRIYYNDERIGNEIMKWLEE